MALPAERDISLYRGDVYAHEFTFVDGDGDAVDLSIYEIAAHWRTREDATAYVEFAIDASQANVGIVVLSLTPVQTAALGLKGVYDLQTTDLNQATPEPTTWVKGKVTLKKDVTRP